jgi:hypothetical protein
MTTGFLTDIPDPPPAARQHIECGAITDACGADRERVAAVLEEVLAKRDAGVSCPPHGGRGRGRPPTTE